MAFRFKTHETVEAALRRIAVERIDRATRVVERACADTATSEEVGSAVHDARKRCKELRALIRLVRPRFKGYTHENTALRDAARLLASLRDVQTRIEAFDDLVQQQGLDPQRFAHARALLVEVRDQRTSKPEDTLRAFLDSMAKARDRANTWALEAKGFKAIQPGLEAIYSKCQLGMATARREPTTLNLHEWRKQVKYNRYHLRLLVGLWPEAINPLRDQAKTLSDLLGRDHDLAELAIALEGSSQAVDGLAQLLELIDRERAATREAAFALGQKLYAQRPQDVGRLAKRLWKQR
ncbi:MAG: CHAD domain-containing protein [Phycisphaerales bacterium]